MRPVPPLRRALGLLLAAVPLAAAPAPRPAGAPLFPPAPASWAGPLGRALTDLASSPSAPPRLASLARLDLGDPVQLRALSPLVEQLSDLELSPEGLAALPADERRTAVALAGEAASAAVEQRVYELGARAAMTIKPGAVPDRDGRARLYGLVKDLAEVRADYGAFLGPAARSLLEKTYAESASYALQVKQALLGGFEEEAEALADDRRRDLAPLSPSASARKLYEQMRASKAGWRNTDLHTVLVGYGFQPREGAKHTLYVHPDFPHLSKSVTRTRLLSPGYVVETVRLIGELETLHAPEEAQAPERDVPPARIDLESLLILLGPRD